MDVRAHKRFEFSAAHQLPDAGPESRLHGHNYILWVGVAGPIDVATGMVINVVALKDMVSGVLDAYDHRNLNMQRPSLPPTTFNVARALWNDIRPALPTPIHLASLDLAEEAGPAVHLDPVEGVAVLHGAFSAAHRTHAPRMSDAENSAMFGICDNPAGHGHNYRAELHVPAETVLARNVWAEFDHRNLSSDIPDLQGRNVVTEALAELIARRVSEAQRVRVWETPSFFAEFRREPRYRLGRRYDFRAAHRLHSPALSDEENRRLYGKCNRPDPHGHTYLVEIIVAGELDAYSETAFDLNRLDLAAAGIMGELDYRYIDQDVPAFRHQPSTGENIAAHLWSRFEDRLGEALEQVRLWETPNNQFAVERNASGSRERSE
jgi:6-pyruvoyltetrahydropterin/6-carboxytetrahydropterin synthase